MILTKLFKSNRSQAVRLPKDVALPEGVEQVSIVKQGQARVVAPANATWDSFFDAPPVSEDFMTDRAQPAPQTRGAL